MVDHKLSAVKETGDTGAAQLPRAKRDQIRQQAANPERAQNLQAGIDKLQTLYNEQIEDEKNFNSKSVTVGKIPVELGLNPPSITQQGRNHLHNTPPSFVKFEYDDNGNCTKVSTRKDGSNTWTEKDSQYERDKGENLLINLGRRGKLVDPPKK